MEPLALHSQQEADKLSARAAELTGYPINLNSPKQTQAWLGIPSTKKEVLQSMGTEGAELLLEYRTHAKAGSTYYRPFSEFSTDGILYPNLNPTGTVIRMNCIKPNLQAIPRKGERYRVKEVFVARPGYRFVELDLQQAEISVLAHYTQDPELLRALSEGINLHDMVSRAQNLPRHTAKQLNFSAQYGIGAEKFGKTYGYSTKEARGYLNAYNDQFPERYALYRRLEKIASHRGYIRLFTGRAMHFNERNQSYKALNRLIQGGVAEMMRLIMLRMDKEIPEFRQLLQVHDSIVGEVPIASCDELLREAKRIFEDQPWCSVPIKADVEVGDSWGALKEWTP
jgi:DNA polymerase-1